MLVYLDMLILNNDRKEPKHQAVKRTWTKVINTESFNQPSMPDTKKHKKTVNVIEKEISPPTSAPEIMSVVSHKDTEQPVETEEIPSSSNKPVAEPIEELEQNISDKENVSVDQPPEQEVELQVCGLLACILIILYIYVEN